MDTKIIDLYNEYTEGLLTRRVFLKNLSILAGGTAAALALLPLLENNHAKAEMVPVNDPRLHTEHIQYPGETGKIRASLARPTGKLKLPGVVVIHENRGLNPHIKDVARRVALKGYIAIAPDALSPLGGTPNDPDEARTMIGKLDGPSTTKNYLAAVKYLKTHPLSTGKVGCIGFCWGGGVATRLQ